MSSKTRPSKSAFNLTALVGLLFDVFYSLRDVLRGLFCKNIPAFQPYGYAAVLVGVDFINKFKKQRACKAVYISVLKKMLRGRAGRFAVIFRFRCRPFQLGNDFIKGLFYGKQILNPQSPQIQSDNPALGAVFCSKPILNLRNRNGFSVD